MDRSFRHSPRPERLAALVLLSALLLCPLLAAAQPHLLGDPGQRNQKEGGFVLSAELGATLNLFNTVGSSRTVVPVGTPSGGLAIGFKSGRVIGTLGLDLSNATELGSSSTTRYTVFLVNFGGQVVLARSADHRVELPLSLQLGLGSAASGGTGFLPLVLGYRIAPGVRYWAHPQLALQLLAGFTGAWYFELERSSGGGTGVNGMSAHFGALAVF